MGKNIRWIAGIITVALICACSKAPISKNQPVISIIPKGVLNKERKQREKRILAKMPTEEKEKTKEVAYIKGGSVSLLKTQKEKLFTKKYTISVNYDSVPVYDFVVDILNKTLNKNFVIEDKIKGNISVVLDGSFTEGELINIVEQILEKQGLTLYKQKGLIIIKKSRTYPKILLTKDFAFWFYKPDFLSPREVYSIAAELISQEGKCKIIGNKLLVIDKKKTVLSIRRLITTLDTEAFSGYSIKIFELKNSTPSVVSKELEKILASIKVSKESWSFIPIDRLDFLVVIASSQKLMDRVTNIVKLLDSTQEKGAKNIYIYKVQYARASDIAKILDNLLSGKKVITTGVKGKKKEVTKIVSSEVVIVPDEINNALIIQASQEDYRKIKSLIDSLDVMPKQVLIEVLIAEITLNKQLENGIEWWLKSNGKQYIAEGSISFGLSGSRSQLFGFTYYGLDPDNFWNFLYFLSTKSDLTVLSSPHILVRDNEDASIEVGKEVPVLSTETVGTVQIQGTAAIDRKIEYRDVGIILKVKPHISDEGFVTLEIVQESSTAERNTVSGIDSPVILKRKIKTTLMVQNGHSIILGGIIDRRNNTLIKKVPLLGDIPFLGNLFSYRSNEHTKTELVIMITPHVIESVNQADVISNLFETRLKKLIKKQK